MTENQRIQIVKLRDSGLGYGMIASQLGVSVNTVKSFCKRNKYNGRYFNQTVTLLTGESTSCENCGSTIIQISKRKKKRFCSDKCRNLWWNAHLDQVKRKAIYDFVCPHCNKHFHVYGDKSRKYCSHDCYIADRFGGGKNE